MSIALFIVGLLLFIGLVVVHEFGHFIMARRNGVKVEEFGIFFPPRLFKHRTKAGWLFSINLIPLGGFVKLKGEHDTDTAPGSFGAASLWVKTKIMAAGVVMNLITAVVLLTILAAIGLPKLIDNQFTVKRDTHTSKQEVLITNVEKDSPAARAGLQPEDRLIAIGLPGQRLQPVTEASSLPPLTKQYAGRTVQLAYSRSGGPERLTTATLTSATAVTKSQQAYQKQLTTAKSCQDVTLPKGYLGVSPVTFTSQRSTWSAPITALGFSAQVTALTFKGLGNAVAGLGSIVAGSVTGNTVARQNGQCAASSQVSGPLGIYFVLKNGSALGYQYMLLIIAIISLTLAIMNILPIPALDGGRLWITLVARSLRRPLSPKREEAINATGFALLMLLIVLITFVDVHRFF